MKVGDDVFDVDKATMLVNAPILTLLIISEDDATDESVTIPNTVDGCTIKVMVDALVLLLLLLG